VAYNKGGKQGSGEHAVRGRKGEIDSIIEGEGGSPFKKLKGSPQKKISTGIAILTGKPSNRQKTIS